MVKIFTSKDKLYTFKVSECTALKTIDFDFTRGYPIVERKPALFIEWENTKGVKLNALAFAEMPTSNEEFAEMWENEFVWNSDPETMRTVQII